MGTAISHSHDQEQRFDPLVMDELDREVDEIITASILDSSPKIALNFATNLVATGHYRGIQLAKLFYELDKAWDKFETDDEIADAIEKATGRPKYTFESYRDFYKYVILPHPELSGKPIRGLINITRAAREDMFSDEDWEELRMAHDIKTMVDIRRRAMDQVSGPKALYGMIERDGQVYAYKGDDKREHALWVNLKADPDSNAGKLVQRVIKAAGLIKR